MVRAAGDLVLGPLWRLCFSFRRPKEGEGEFAEHALEAIAKSLLPLVPMPRRFSSGRAYLVLLFLQYASGSLRKLLCGRLFELVGFGCQDGSSELMLLALLVGHLYRVIAVRGLC